jgi:putative transposase
LYLRGISQQTKAKSGLQAIWMADTRAQATSAFDAFLTTYEAKYPKAAVCLAKDRDAYWLSMISRLSTGSI